MTYGQSSAATSYNPFASDILLDAYERCGVYALENKHLYSGRRSLNLLLTSDWSNRGINLWSMAEVVIPLIEDVIQYNLTRDIAAVYDCYRRQYSMNPAQNYPVSFSTTLGSPNVTIAIPGSSSPVGSYVSVQVPVAVGGLVISGFYQAIANPTLNSVTIVAASNATSTITNGGVLPQFQTAINSQNVTVVLAAHGLSQGQPFNVPVPTIVGGITIFGSYTVQSVSAANTFVIQASSNALSGAVAFENGGQASIAVQNQVTPYSDILMTQLSRTDYAAQTDKTASGPPTTIWVNKQIIPQFSVWPVTDSTGPYEMHLWCMKQIQDVNPTGGQTLDLPPRMYYAMTLDLARDLSMKFAPAKYNTLKTEAIEAWARAESSDVEPTSTFIMPQMPNGL